MPKCREPQLWAPALINAMTKFDITDPSVIAVFLAQLAVESGELTRVAEDLTYSAERLMAVWPKRFPTMLIASQCAGQPEKLANFVYAGRMGNGNTASGDGYRYRGRGLIQLTGLANYKLAQQALGLPLVKAPQLLQDKPVAAMSAAWYWKKTGCSDLAADIADDNDAEDFRTITRRINGGEEGLVRRKAYHVSICNHLGIPS